ncbi:MAG: hypothetical protein ACK5Z2_08200 [Bacteroidota bacterium]|jgi:hypothetical protein
MYRILFLLLISTVSFAQTLGPALFQIRNKFENANKSEADCNTMLGSVRGNTLEKNPVYYGYLGAAETIHAQFSYNPYTKLSRFNSGKEKLEAAIAKQPQSMELRYLRFTVQSGAPSFLGYNTQIAGDKKFLLDGLKNLSVTDYDLYKRISGYLKQSVQLTAAEKQQLTAIINSSAQPGK